MLSMRPNGPDEMRLMSVISLVTLMPRNRARDRDRRGADVARTRRSTSSPVTMLTPRKSLVVRIELIWLLTAKFDRSMLRAETRP